MKASTLVKNARGCGLCFPVVGVDGYAGEQDGSTVILSDILHADTLADIDEMFPDGIGEWTGVHWSRYLGRGRGYPESGWEFVLGRWSE